MASVPWLEESTPEGRLCVRRRRFAREASHGVAPLLPGSMLGNEELSLLALDHRFLERAPGRVLFLDTETTGLSGGTGTLAFLIGLAFFEGDELIVEQFVIPRPGEERPALTQLQNRLAESSLLVTYNGKSFDWPLIKNRFVMNRKAAPPAVLHFDALHAARRVFRHRGAGSRLTELEVGVLGHTRHGDIPGAEIPERYFRSLREGPALLTPVLSHNEEDLLALVALIGRMASVVRAGVAPDGAEALGYAELCWRGGAMAKGDLFAAQALSSSNGGALRGKACVVSAQYERQRSAYRVAASRLEEALPLLPPSSAAVVRLELAKLYEHRLKEPWRALALIEKGTAERGEEHTRRLNRLQRKAQERDGLGLFAAGAAAVEVVLNQRT